ncbi:MAG: hypothetical protein MJY98_04835 [Fibrobacter sp.]|nr:hypothetical protein [Fibrobacter sp.]
MKKWVWHISLAAASAFGALFVACSNDKTAGSSFETENSVASVAMKVQLPDGNPAARTQVLVRPSSFLAGASSRAIDASVAGDVVESDSAAGIFNETTDDQGRLNLPKMKPGSYVIEVRGETMKAVASVDVKDSSCDSVSMTLAKTGSLKGQVVMPYRASSVSVGIQGLDYVVQTDGHGEFEFTSLPAGEFSAVGFIYTEQEIAGGESVGTTQILGSKVVEISTKSGNGDVEDVIIGSRPVPVPVDTVPEDTVAEDTTPAYPYVLFEDFEDSTYGWYTTVSRYAEAALSADEAGFDRDGLCARFEYQADSMSTWTLMGRAFTRPQDLSDLDSVVFWVRATERDSQWVSFSFDVLVDSATAAETGYENGKSWIHFRKLSTEWNRLVVYPDSLIPTDSIEVNAGNIGWDAVKTHVTNINVFAGSHKKGSSHELFVDDIEFFGAEIDESVAEETSEEAESKKKSEE